MTVSSAAPEHTETADLRVFGALIRDLPEWIRDYAREFVPPDDMVTALMLGGELDKARSRYWMLVCAANMGLTTVEYQRRYPTPRRGGLDAKRCVYFISAAPTPRVGCLVKIGIASNAKTRLAGIQVHHPKTLYLWGTTQGGVSLERDLHERFDECRVRGEWFKVTPELKAYIKENAL